MLMGLIKKLVQILDLRSLRNFIGYESHLVLNTLYMVETYIQKKSLMLIQPSTEMLSIFYVLIIGLEITQPRTTTFTISFLRWR